MHSLCNIIVLFEEFLSFDIQCIISSSSRVGTITIVIQAGCSCSQFAECATKLQ